RERTRRTQAANGRGVSRFFRLSDRRPVAAWNDISAADHIVPRAGCELQKRGPRTSARLGRGRARLGRRDIPRWPQAAVAVVGLAAALRGNGSQPPAGRRPRVSIVVETASPNGMACADSRISVCLNRKALYLRRMARLVLFASTASMG